MTGTSEAATLLKRVAEFLKNLSPEDALALESGDARLAVVRKTPRDSTADPRAADIARVSEDLKAINDPAMAARYLTELNLQPPQAVELAEGLGVPVDGEDSVATIVARIVERKVGEPLGTNPSPGTD